MSATRDHQQEPTTADAARRGVSGTVVVVVLALVVLIVVGYFALGMPGMDHTPDAPHDMENMQPAAVTDPLR